MNFNQLTAAAAAAAAGNPNNLSMSNFTTAVTNILANSNIDLSQLANIGNHLPGFSAALELRRNQQQSASSNNSSQNSSSNNLNNNTNNNSSSTRQSLHHRLSSSNNSSTTNHAAAAINSSLSALGLTGASLANSNQDLVNSLSNLQNTDAATAAAAAAAAAASVAHLPASISNLTSSALADLAANAAAAAVAHQPQAHQSLGGPNSRSTANSIQSAHNRSASNHHHQLTAAHQSTSSKVANLSAHQSKNSSIHHRHASSASHHHNSALSGNHLNHHHHLSINNINHHSNNLHNISSGSNLSLMNNSMNSVNNLNSSLTAAATTTPQTTATIIATNNTNSITPPKSSTCYRIGDCVYFESSPLSSSTNNNNINNNNGSNNSTSLPSSHQIGKIDEICKLNGDSSNIEVKVVVFFRRRDIPSSLMTLADKYQYDESQEEEIQTMSEKDKNSLKQRELFYSRQIETIPAAAIRGKCTVQLLNESESLASYLSKEDYYFYTLVYDPQQKTISADRGEIRVGQRYQAEVQPSPIYTYGDGGDPVDPRDLNELETLMYTPDHQLSDDEINKFLTIAKSVGTFARALDCSSSIKQPSLHLTAASASRDVTLLYAMQLLHQNNYDLGKAVCALVPSTGPVLCRDEIEEWTAGEATLFEEAIEKYGREFGDIRQDFLPWKSVKNIVEYYYMWKTTDRSINQRRMKALEAENKVTILYIADPGNELQKSSPARNVAASSPDANKSSTNKIDNNIDIKPSAVSLTTTTAASNTSTTNTTSESGCKTTSRGSLKRPQESDDSTLNSSIENTNATLKRRQVTEPKLSAHVACHTTPGENLRFISTKRHKLLRRGMINRKQLRHLSRRPWERRAKSRV